jgi:hypothetical protein
VSATPLVGLTTAEKPSISTSDAVPIPTTITPVRAATPAPVIEEEDDPAATVPAGTKCRHHACSVVYESDALHRSDAEGSKCIYHPKAVRTISRRFPFAHTL